MINKYGNITYYGNSKALNNLIQKVQKECYYNLNLKSNVLHDAVVYPAENFNNMFIGGIFNDGKFVSAHQHSYKYGEYWGNFIPQENFRRDLDKENYKAGNILYGGIIWNHFGHFISESLSRLYHLIKNNNYDEVVFLSHPSLNIHNLPQYITKILNLFDVKWSFISNPCRVEYLTIPEQSFYVYGGPFSSDNYHLIYEYISDRINKTQDLLSYEKIYLSRSEFVKNDIYEKSLLDFFSNRGYVIISPEKYSIEQQIYFVNKAKYIATSFGTLSHLLLFANSSSHQTILIRNSEERCKYICEPQIKISLSTRSSNINFVDAGTEILPFLHHYIGPFLMVANENLEQCFSSAISENKTTIVKNDEKEHQYKIEGLFFYFLKYIENLSKHSSLAATVLLTNPEQILLSLLKNLDYYINNDINNFKNLILKGYDNSKFVGQDCYYYLYKLDDNAENRKLIMNFETLSTNVQPSFCKKINLSKDGEIVDLEKKQNSYPKIYWAVYKDSLCFFDEEMNFLRKFQENETLPLADCLCSGGYIHIHILKGLKATLSKPKIITSRDDFILQLKEKQKNSSLNLDLHLSNIGWINDLVTHESTNNPTTNAIEALRISPNKSNFSFEYCTEYAGNWGEKVKVGELSGTIGKSTAITGFVLYLTPETAENYEIFYRIADKNAKWSDWIQDGNKVSINDPVVDIAFKVITKSNLNILNHPQNIVEKK